MTNKNVWIAGVAVPVMIAMILLAGSFSVAANAEPSAAAASVKIDNFVFGPQTLTVPIGATVTWTNRMTFLIRQSVQRVCSSPRCWIRMNNSPTHLPRRERIPTTARSTRR